MSIIIVDKNYVLKHLSFPYDENSMILEKNAKITNCYGETFTITKIVKICKKYIYINVLN